MVYRPLKYKDDGRDVVTFLDFLTIHCTFPAINAWISYQLYFCLFITTTTVCDTTYLEGLGTEFCNNYKAIVEPKEKYTYFYSLLRVPSYFVFCLLFAEASINLTYYKDCVFAFVTFMIYIGMLWVNFQYKTTYDEDDKLLDLNQMSAVDESQSAD